MCSVLGLRLGQSALMRLTNVISTRSFWTSVNASNTIQKKQNYSPPNKPQNVSQVLRNEVKPWSVPCRCLTVVPDKPVWRKNRLHFTPSLWKRLHKCGLEARLATEDGRKILWNKYLKGKWKFTPHDKFLLNPPRYGVPKRWQKQRYTVPKRFPK